MSAMVSPGQTVFARWGEKYYYPALVDEVLEQQIRVSYLDGDVGLVAKEDVLELQKGFEMLQFQGNWQHGGVFFKGKIASHLPGDALQRRRCRADRIEPAARHAAEIRREEIR